MYKFRLNAKASQRLFTGLQDGCPDVVVTRIDANSFVTSSSPRLNCRDEWRTDAQWIAEYNITGFDARLRNLKSPRYKS